MHHITIGNKTYKAPSAWEELTQRDLQLIAIYDQLVNTSPKAALSMLRRLFNVPSKIFRTLKASQKVQLYPLIYWLMERNTLYKWLIPTIQGRALLWKGPKDRLANLTAEQFMYAEGAYEQWLKTGNSQYLNTLVAVLYSKYVFFDLIPLKFRAERLELYSTEASYIKPYIKKAIALNYAGCRNYIIERHPHIWKAAYQSADEIPGNGVTPWAGIILDLAGDKFGTHQQTIRENIWLVLADLDKKAKRYEEMEDQYK